MPTPSTIRSAASLNPIRRWGATLLVTSLLAAPAFAAGPDDARIDGLIVIASPHPVSETVDRMESALEDAEIGTLRWDHADKAAGVDIELRPTELLMFGNPALGSHFFTSAQSAGIDLPLKAIVWEDADGQVWLGYNDPAWLAARHGIDDRDEVVKRMQGALTRFAGIATAED